MDGLALQSGMTKMFESIRGSNGLSTVQGFEERLKTELCQIRWIS